MKNGKYSDIIYTYFYGEEKRGFMRIIVVGMGKTGDSLLKNLTAEDHDIIGIDMDGGKVQEAIEKYDVNGVVGNGCLAPILQEARVEEADLLIAVTDRDELNLLTCIVGKSLGARHLIAQVRNPEYYANYASMGEHLGIDMFVNLEATLAGKISAILKAPAEVNLNSFGRGRLEIAEIRITSGNKMVGKTLSQIRQNRRKPFLVISIERNEEVIVPNGKTVIESGDVLSVCSGHQDLREVLGYFGIEKQKVQSVIILGCEENVYYLSKRLLEAGISVKVIAKNKVRCEALKTRIPELTVICDDYTDKEVLIREGIDETDSLVAMTVSEENNIVASLFAKTHEVPKIVTVIGSDLYREMLEDISLNLVYSPYELAGSAIATYIRSINVPKDSQIISMNKIAGGRAEALQFNIAKSQDFVGKKIADLAQEMKGGVLLCAIIRNRMPIIPDGETVLEEDDDILVASMKIRIEKLEDILK